MAELRYNPLLDTWTMVAGNRQSRPNMPKDWCPFCPGSGRVPDTYDVYKYDNDFPVLSINPGEADPVGSLFYKSMQAYGRCEVILYSSEHTTTMHELSLLHLQKLIELWISRFKELSADKKIKYIFPFENKGEEVGVTMPHPHGQIYAYPFIPLKIRTELNSASLHFDQHHECLICRINKEEKDFGRRIIYENKSFIAYLPYFTDYPYGVFLAAKDHINYLPQLNKEQVNELAEALKVITGSFDCLFDRPFPYMMNFHSNPVNSTDYPGHEKYYHFHIEFYPPLRSKDRIKYYASSEMGAWAAANVAPVEDTARQLRSAKLKYLSGWDKEHLRTEIVKEFVQFYGESQIQPQLFSAPARVNLIGEHIDYNGGMVLPAALDFSIYMAIRQRKDLKIYLTDMNYSPERIEIDLKGKLQHNPDVRWADYPKGILKVFSDNGYNLKQGCDVLFFSEIPAGAGVSSSAAFEVVFAYGLADINGFKIDKKKIAVFCQKAENEFVGVSCGIMDQFAVAMGKKGNGILLNCATLEFEYVPLELNDYSLVLTNTNKKRGLIDSKYNERLGECREALARLQKQLKIKDLCSLDSKTLAANEGLIGDPVLYRRARHVVTENERVKIASQALRQGDLEQLGRVMSASHISLRDDYEVTGIELDTLYDEAKGYPDCIGTRMTGAGFGGCTISIVKTVALDDFKKCVTAGYRSKTGLEPSFYICSVGDGVKKENYKRS